MKEYVCGFYFDHLLKQVVLIWKNKAAWQAGKLNGVGGKIEPGESPSEAMRREFKEEAGIDHPIWDRVVNIAGADWKVHFFSAVGKANEFEYVATMEDEEVAKIEIDRLHDFDYIPNLEWLIPLALQKIEYPSERLSFL